MQRLGQNFLVDGQLGTELHRSLKELLFAGEEGDFHVKTLSFSVFLPMCCRSSLVSTGPVLGKDLMAMTFPFFWPFSTGRQAGEGVGGVSSQHCLAIREITGSNFGLLIVKTQI